MTNLLEQSSLSHSDGLKRFLSPGREKFACLFLWGGWAEEELRPNLLLLTGVRPAMCFTRFFCKNAVFCCPALKGAEMPAGGGWCSPVLTQHSLKA